MKRLTLIPILLAGAMMATAPADAQRRGAPVTQGVTSGDLVTEIGDLRVANAETGAKISGLESDIAALNGEIETLEFLLSQSRDQVNDMQADDAEIGKLIQRLEQRLTQQDAKISALETQMDAREAVPMVGPTVTTRSSDGTIISSAPSGVTRTVTSNGDTVTRSVPSPVTTSSQPSSTVTVTGPTRIVRRTVTGPASTAGGSVTTSAPATSSVTTSSASGLPQGTLGTLPASALPGEAGPLFAEAKARLLQFDYAGAESAFRLFLTSFGDDAQAGEAQYWLGEALYQQQAYAEAGQAYTTMIREYPDDARAPEALAKLARSMRLVGDTARACSMLDLLPTRYPEASGVTRNLANGERVRSGCDS
jgi:tol-pal system protein YbgF